MKFNNPNFGDINISNEQKMTPAMKKYETETGKKAVWRGVITDGFKKWEKGEKIYIKDRERINILVPEAKKSKWQNFANEKEISTLSKLIRESVDFYISSNPKILKLKKFDQFSHDIKEKLSSIKGFSQLLIEEHKDELNWNIISKLKEIFDQSLNLEKIINSIFEIKDKKNFQYDILIIDDDNSTVYLLTEFFKKKGYVCKEVSQSSEVIDLLIKNSPKIILLDVLLPEINGYELCKMIKSNNKLKNIPIFFITAVPESEVEEKIKETKAEGYFLKPFDMLEFNSLLDYL